MKSSAKMVSLNPVDDLFTTEEQREDKKREKVRNIPLNELHPFRDHPFKVVDDEKMEETVESIREYGVLVPIIARPKEEGGYEIISGHRRCHASEKAGLETILTIVRDLDDDEATIIMVDSNLQRESLLPSERAKAYKMKSDAIKRQGQRNDLTSPQIAANPSAYTTSKNYLLRASVLRPTPYFSARSVIVPSAYFALRKASSESLRSLP